MAVRTRGSCRCLRNDNRAVEGFLTEIPALAVMTIAVTTFMITAVSAYGLYLDDRARADALEEARDISTAIRTWAPILVDGRANHLSVSALDRLASGEMTLDLRNTGDMTVTVLEYGDAGADGEPGATGTWTFGNTDRKDAAEAAVTKSVLIGHFVDGRSPVYRLGSVEVRVW